MADEKEKTTEHHYDKNFKKKDYGKNLSFSSGAEKKDRRTLIHGEPDSEKNNQKKKKK